MSVTRIEDLDPSIQPIVERAWRAFMEGEQLDSVTMTASEYERFWKGLGYEKDPGPGVTLCTLRARSDSQIELRGSDLGKRRRETSDS